MVDDNLEDLIEQVGEACSGSSVAQVLTALTYILADTCVQSGLAEDEFLSQLVINLTSAINDIEGAEHGRSTHH